MTKRGLGSIVAVLLALLTGTAFGQACLTLDPEVPLTEAAAELTGFGCFAGRADAIVHWSVSDNSINSRPVLVELEHAGPNDLTVALLNQDGTELAQLVTDAGSASASWLLQAGDFRLSVSGAAGERYVLSLSSLNRRTDHDIRVRSSDAPHRLNGPLGLVANVGPEPYYLRWTIPEDSVSTWELDFIPGPGVEVNVKMFAADGTMLDHYLGGPGESVRIPEMELEAGEYTFVAAPAGWQGAALQFHAAPLGPVAADGVKTGRPGSLATANRISIGTGVRGQLAEDHRDIYRLDLTEEEAGVYDINVASSDNMDLCVLDSSGESLACYRGTEGTGAANVNLPVGTSYVTVEGRRQDEPAYTLQFEAVSAPDEIDVIAPNGNARLAHLITDGMARLEHRSRTTSWLAFHVDEPGLHRVQLQGPDLATVQVLDGGRAVLRSHSPRGERVLRIDNVPLRAGLNYISVDARAGEYALRVLRTADLPEPEAPMPAAPATDEVAARPEGVVVPGINVNRQSSVRLQPGSTYTATSLQKEEYAHYRFSLQNEAIVRLTLQPPEDTWARLYLAPGRTHENREPGGAIVLEHWLPAGDYDVQARMMDHTDGWYSLTYEQLDPFDHFDGLYPVGLYNAPLLQGDLRVTLPAALAENSFYLLPEITESSVVTLRFEPDVSGAWLYLRKGRDGDRLSAAGKVAGEYTYEVEPGQYFLRLDSGQAWDVQVTVDSLAPEISNLAYDVSLNLELGHDEVAAWSYWGQQLNGELVVSNSGATEYSLELLTHASDPRVQFRLPEELQLAAGEEVTLPVKLTLPADVQAFGDLVFSVAATDGLETTGSAQAAVLTRCDAPLVRGRSWWPMPDSLLGSWNVAWGPFGAALPDVRSTDNASFDGRVSPARPPVRSTPHELLLDLGAERTIMATALHPFGSGSAFQRLRNFRIEVSADGEEWTVVLEDSLQGANTEQYFEFDEPVSARFAKLTMLDGQAVGNHTMVGEWKLLTQDAPLAERNIAAAGLGGHVVWSDPLISSRSVMLADPDFGDNAGRSEVSVREGGALPEWTVGFHHNRVARISSLEWLDNDREQNVTALQIWTSTESPLGPWEPLGDWQLERTDGRAGMTLAEPVWARFVRFQVLGATPERTVKYQLPGQLRIIEADDYRSILSEWGFDSNWSDFEYSNPELFSEATVAFGTNTDADAALLLNDSETGYVQTGVTESWYRFVIPENHNEATVVINSEPGVALGYELFAEDGELLDGGISDGDVLTVSGESGSEYLLRIYEPPRSVLFAWDTSGSVSPYSRQIYAALETFAGAIRGDLESVMLLAFGRQPHFLLPEWSGDAAEVSLTLNEYDRSDDSSDAETQMVGATTALQNRDGVRAIVLITDAESSGYRDSLDMWKGLEATGAQVYTLEVSTAGSAYSQDLMQDWAAANNGHYVNATTLGELESGFARADCLIRRAKYHEVSVSFEQRASTPGSLAVSLPEESTDGSAATQTLTSASAVQVILDASGSMWRTLEGRYRYEIANDVLTELVSEVLPAEVPFALRVFGNRQADICRTDLEVALAPLDAASVVQTISGIVPQSFAGTPLAESIRLAAADLTDASGPRTVILITDGEESCDGDVEAAISELRSAGFDVVLNIIGFDFDADDEAAAQQRFREWAALGGGQYFDANSAAELSEAVTVSVALPFEVADADGVVVARGTVGGPQLEIDGGVYTVTVLAEEPIVIPDVRIDGETVRLVLE